VIIQRKGAQIVNAHRFIRIVATLTILLPASAVAQSNAKSAARPAKVALAPRAADGKPDLTGVYQGGSTKPGTWEEANQGIGVAAPEDRAIVGPAPRQVETPAYQPWAAKLMLDNYNRRNIDSSSANCIPNVAFMTVSLFPVQFVQTPQQIVILEEYMSVFRIIPLNVKHSDDAEPAYLGNSVGHWEGDTLVVDTVGFKEMLHAEGGGGRSHSDALHLTERFTRTDYNTINYDVIWDDPKMLTRPFHLHSSFMLRPGTRVQEFRCEENNLEPARYEELKKDESLFKRP
jgi:hypothetical protein